MAEIIGFPNSEPPGSFGPDPAAQTHKSRVRSASQSKLSVISCRGSDDLDARLRHAAEALHLTKSQLIHDIAVRFLAQMGRQGLLRASKLDRAQRTRELARELFDLWSDDPGATSVQEKLA